MSASSLTERADEFLLEQVIFCVSRELAVARSVCRVLIWRDSPSRRVIHAGMCCTKWRKHESVSSILILTRVLLCELDP
jgi:hypothetical protein